MNWITNSAAMRCGQRQQHILEKAHRPGAVDARGLHQFVGHGQEELPEQERGGGRGDQRHGQAGIGVEHAQVGHHLVGGQMRTSTGSISVMKIIQKKNIGTGSGSTRWQGRQQRDGDLADSDDQRGDEGLAASSPTGCATMRLP
jgi:hypothetical protein